MMKSKSKPKSILKTCQYFLADLISVSWRFFVATSEYDDQPPPTIAEIHPIPLAITDLVLIDTVTHTCTCADYKASFAIVHGRS